MNKIFVGITFLLLIFCLSNSASASVLTIYATSPAVASDGQLVHIMTLYISGGGFNQYNQYKINFVNESGQISGTTYGKVQTNSSISFTVPSSLPANNYTVNVADVSGNIVASGSSQYPTGNKFTKIPKTETILLKSTDSNTVYTIINNKKIAISSQNAFDALGYKAEEIKIVDRSTIESYKDPELLKLIDNDRIYFVVNTSNEKKLLWIPSAEAFVNRGFKWPDVVSVSSYLWTPFYPDMVKLAKAKNSVDVYSLFPSVPEGLAGYRLKIPSVKVFEAEGYNWRDIIELESADMQMYTPLIDGFMMKLNSMYADRVYYVSGGIRHWVTTMSKFYELGGYDKLMGFSEEWLSYYREGDPI